MEMRRRVRLGYDLPTSCYDGNVNRQIIMYWMETVWQAYESLSTDCLTAILNEAADGLKLKEFENALTNL